LIVDNLFINSCFAGYAVVDVRFVRLMDAVTHTLVSRESDGRGRVRHVGVRRIEHDEPHHHRNHFDSDHDRPDQRIGVDSCLHYGIPYRQPHLD
jgi:hypothetical protein